MERTVSSPYNFQAIRHLLTKSFSHLDLENLCFDLFIDVLEDLPQDTPTPKLIHRIVIEANKRDLMPELLSYIQEEQPDHYQQYLFSLNGASFSAPETINQSRSTLICNTHHDLQAPFYGREAEKRLLNKWFQHDEHHPILTIVGASGIGKSALAWHWLQEKQKVNQLPPLIVWWNFHQPQSHLSQMIDVLLNFFGDDIQQFRTLREAIKRLKSHLKRTPSLIIIDEIDHLFVGTENGIIDLSKAHYCKDQTTGRFLRWLADGRQSKTKTLITSTDFPYDLLGRDGKMISGIRHHQITGLSGESAYELLREFNIACTSAEVQAVGDPIQYHPLTLKLLASWVTHDPKAPHDLRVAANYMPTASVLANRQHILASVYGRIPQSAQTLLSRIAAFRHGVNEETILQAIGGGNKVRRDLALLKSRHLFYEVVQEKDGKDSDSNESSTSQILLHPSVQEFAYQQLTNKPVAHQQLAKYFAKKRKNGNRSSNTAKLDELLEIQYHLAKSGQIDVALRHFKSQVSPYLQNGLEQKQRVIELLAPLTTDQTTNIENDSTAPAHTADLWLEKTLARLYSQLGQAEQAAAHQRHVVQISQQHSHGKDVLRGLASLAKENLYLGQLTEAEKCLRGQIALSKKGESKELEAKGYQEYGRLLAYTGQWNESRKALKKSTRYWESVGDKRNLCIDYAHQTLLALLKQDGETADAAAQKALHLAESTAGIFSPFDKDSVRVYWLAGRAALITGQLQTAKYHLSDALRRCRTIDYIQLEPAIILANAQLARACSLESQSEDKRHGAYKLANEALRLAEQNNYRLVLADTHLHLAVLALDEHKTALARQHIKLSCDYAHTNQSEHIYFSIHEQACSLLREIGI